MQRVLVLWWAQRPITSAEGSKQPQQSIPARSTVCNYHCNIWHINTDSRVWMGFQIHFRAFVLLVPRLCPASCAPWSVVAVGLIHGFALAPFTQDEPECGPQPMSPGRTDSGQAGWRKKPNSSVRDGATLETTGPATHCS